MSWRETFQQVFGDEAVEPVTGTPAQNQVIEPNGPVSDQALTYWRWWITWPTGETMEVHYTPEATRARVAGDYPDALDVEPVPEPALELPSHDLCAALVLICRDLPIAPEMVMEALAPEDLADWQAGRLPAETLRSFARCLSVRASAAEQAP